MGASTFYGVRFTRVTTVAKVHDYIQEKSGMLRYFLQQQVTDDQVSDLEDAVEDDED